VKGISPKGEKKQQKLDAKTKTLGREMDSILGPGKKHHLVIPDEKGKNKGNPRL